ncbi:MAG: hypothetical protein DWQ06_11200 [Calditrichaeota bacterium]|nr:MAG: hypothetical protein DWQ06_11200 [Calditrichota bacterium]
MKIFFKILLWVLIIFSISPLFVFEEFAKSSLIFSYPPRFILAFLSILIFGYFGFQKKSLVSIISIFFFFINIYFIGLNFGNSIESENGFTVLSFNIHNTKEKLSEFKTFCKKNKVDFLILQEVKKRDRRTFSDVLSDYKFYAMNENEEFEHKNYSPFSSVIGIRKSLLTKESFIETAITGYRTFALKIEIQEREIWLVNVHTTKAFYLDKKSSLSDLIEKASDKADWHLKESELLNKWISSKNELPILISGDFNAPFYSSNLNLSGMRNAHSEVGIGFHLTFPRAFPVWGIDHTLGNEKVRFQNYETINFGFSDHKGQLFKIDF